MRIVYIMRGIPGSGKSFLADKIAGEIGCVCSTDYFFMEDDRTYNFNPRNLTLYHKMNFLFFKLALANNVPIVVCDNTNIRHVDYEPYLKAAREFGYEIKVVSIRVDIEFALKRCVHNVPGETIKNMLSRWED